MNLLPLTGMETFLKSIFQQDFFVLNLLPLTGMETLTRFSNVYPVFAEVLNLLPLTGMETGVA